MEERSLATAVTDVTAGLLWFMLAGFHTYGISLHLLADRLTVSVLCGLVLT